MAGPVSGTTVADRREDAGLQADVGLSLGASFRLRAALSIAPGETVALLGPNGAGKSSLVDAIAGLRAIQQGRIALGEAVLDDPNAGVFVPPERRRIGVVFQDLALFPHLSALDNVAFGLEARGRSRRDARATARAWLERVGMAAQADSRPAALSGGQAQRVALARSLVVEPALLLLDEPLAALDVASRAEIRRLLAEHLSRFDGPRLLITHEPTEAFLLADRVVVLEQGCVVQSGTPDEIRRHPRTRYVADLAGLNLLQGEARGGHVHVEGGPPIHAADAVATGPVLLTIHPRSISLYPGAPHGSPRNTWQATVAVVEAVEDRVRVQLREPHPLTVELTVAATRELGLAPGATVWVAIKSTEVGVRPA